MSCQASCRRHGQNRNSERSRISDWDVQDFIDQNEVISRFINTCVENQCSAHREIISRCLPNSILVSAITMPFSSCTHVVSAYPGNLLVYEIHGPMGLKDRLLKTEGARAYRILGSGLVDSECNGLDTLGIFVANNLSGLVRGDVFVLLPYGSLR